MNNKYHPHLMGYMIALHNFGWQSETFIELVIYLLLCLRLCLYLYLFRHLSFNLLNTHPINAIDCVLNTNYINTIENGGFFCLLFLDNLKRSTQMKRQFSFIIVRLKRLLCFIAIKLGKKNEKETNNWNVQFIKKKRKFRIKWQIEGSQSNGNSNDNDYTNQWNITTVAKIIYVWWILYKLAQ